MVCFDVLDASNVEDVALNVVASEQLEHNQYDAVEQRVVRLSCCRAVLQALVVEQNRD